MVIMTKKISQCPIEYLVIEIRLEMESISICDDLVIMGMNLMELCVLMIIIVLVKAQIQCIMVVFGIDEILKMGLY